MRARWHFTVHNGSVGGGGHGMDVVYLMIVVTANDARRSRVAVTAERTDNAGHVEAMQSFPSLATNPPTPCPLDARHTTPN